jgi:hypothetical protein
MKKRSLLLGFVAAAIAAFILSGCESPTGSNGSPGRDGPGLALLGEEISPEALEAWFKATDTVILPAYTGSKTTISGVIPSGKTLVITGGEFVLKRKEAVDGITPPALTVQGGLELQKDSALDAGYYNDLVGGRDGGAGWLKLEGDGYLTGEGTVKLPYLVAAEGEVTGVRADIVHYEKAPGSLNKLPVSYIGANDDASLPVSELNHAGLVKIFELLAPENGDPEKASNAFTTSIKTVLEDVLEDGEDATDYSRAVPAGKTLTLTGEGSTIDGTVAGELVVTGTLTAEDGDDEDTVVTLSLPAGGSIVVNGELEVTALNLESTAGTDDTPAVDNGGTLVVNNKGTLRATGEVTAGSISDPDDPTATTPNITISAGGTLDLSSSGSIGGTLVNNGAITSASVDADVVTDLLTLPAGTGKVVLSGDDVDLGSAALALTQNIEIAGKVNAPTAPTGTTGAFVPFTGGKTITIDDGGQLALGDAENIETGSFAGTAVTIVNNGAITTTSTDSGVLKDVIAAVAGISVRGIIALDLQTITVESGETLEVPNGLSVTGDQITVKGTFIAPGVGTPFVTGTVIIIENGGVLKLTAANTSFDGISISNGGTIATPETAGDKLNNILALGGRVEITGTAAVSLSGAIIVPDGSTLDTTATLTVAGTITVKSGGELAVAPSVFAADGKVVFEYGSVGPGIGVTAGYNWVDGVSYSKITLTNGKTELTAGAFSYGDSGSTASLSIPEGVALTVDGSLTVETFTLNGTVTVKSGKTLASSVVGGPTAFLGKIVFEENSTGKNADGTVTVIGSGGVYQWDGSDKTKTAKFTLQSGVTTLSGGSFTYNQAGATGASIAGIVIVDPDAGLSVSGSAGLSGVLGVYGTLDIAGSKTLTLNSGSLLRANGTVIVKGTLDAVEDDTLAVNGTVTVKSGATFEGPTGIAEIAFGGDGKIALEQGSTGNYGSTPIISAETKYTWDPNAANSVVTLKDGLTELSSGKFVYNGDGTADNTAVTLGKAATLTVNNNGTFTVGSSLTVAGTLNVKSGNIEVTSGGALTLETPFNVPKGSSLKVTESDGALNVNANLTVAGTLETASGSTLVVAETVTVKDGGAYKAAAFTGNGNVVFEYGSTGTNETKKVAGKNSGTDTYDVNWNDVALSSSKVSLFSDGAEDLSAVVFNSGITLNNDIKIASGTSFTVKDDITVAGDLTVPNDAELAVDKGATLTVATSGEVTINGKLTVAENVASDFAAVEVKGELVLENGSGPGARGFKGVIAVLNGGILRDKKDGGNSLWPNATDTGTIAFVDGGSGYRVSSATEVFFAGVKDSGALIEVSVPSSGHAYLALGKGRTNLVNGDAELTGNYSPGVDKIALDKDSTFTVAKDVTLTITSELTVEGTLDVTATGALLAFTAGTVYVKDGGTYNAAANFTGTGSVVLEQASTGVVGARKIISNDASETGTEYKWDTSGSEKGTVTLTAGGGVSPDNVTPVSLVGNVTVPAGGKLNISENISLLSGATLTLKDGAGLTVTAGKTFTVGGSVTVNENATISVPALAILDVVTDGAITVEGGLDVAGTFGVDEDSVITVKKGENATTGGTITVSGALNLEKVNSGTEVGEITVDNGGKLKISDSATVSLEGKITVNSGGISYDYVNSFVPASSNVGVYVFKSGAEAYTSYTDSSGDTQLVLWIGSAASATDPIIELTTGAFTSADGKYELSGTATLRGNFNLTDKEFELTTGSTFTVALTWAGVDAPPADGAGNYGAYLLKTGATGAKFVGDTDSQIVVKVPETVIGGGIYIQKANGDGQNFYNSSNTKIQTIDSADYAVIAATSTDITFDWSEDADGSGGEGWLERNSTP